MRGTRALLVLVFLVQIASLRSLDKYVFHQRLASLVAAAALGALSLGLVRFGRLRSYRLARAPLAPAALVAAAALVSLFVYPVADGLKLSGRGSDSDDALIQGAQNLFLHFDPYRAPTYLGNPLSPGPGWILLASPFAMTGLYALFFPFCLGLLVFLLRKAGAAPVAILEGLLVLLAGLGVWQAMAVGGDLLPLGVGLVACLVPLRSGWKNPGSFVAYVLMVSLLLTGRVVLPILIPLIGLHLQRSGRRREALLFVASAGLGTCLVHGVFYVQPSSYMPFFLLRKGLNLLGHLAPLDPRLTAAVLVLALAVCGIALASRFRGPATHSGLALSAAVSLTLPLSLVALGDLAERQFALADWEGSNYLLVTLPLWLYYYALDAADPAVRPSS